VAIFIFVRTLKNVDRFLLIFRCYIHGGTAEHDGINPTTSDQICFCTPFWNSNSFYAPQLYRQVLLRRVLAMGILSVCLSVCLSRPGGIPSPDEIETPGLHHMIARSLYSFLWGNLVPLGEGVPLERGHQKVYPPLEIVILPLLAHLAWKRLQIDADFLPIITSTADELSSGTNIDDLEWPWTPKIGGFSEFLAILGCNTHFKTELRRNRSR